MYIVTALKAEKSMRPTWRILSEKGTKSETEQKSNMAAEQTGGQHFECAVRLMLNVELT